VPTPLWFALLEDQRLVIHAEARTGTVRRLRHDLRARVFSYRPCSSAGVDGRARTSSAREAPTTSWLP
jgi:hypothetical protein